MKLIYPQENLEEINKGNTYSVTTVNFQEQEKLKHAFIVNCRGNENFSFGYHDGYVLYGVDAAKVDWMEDLYRCVMTPEKRKRDPQKVFYIAKDGSILYNMIDLVMEDDIRHDGKLIKDEKAIKEEINFLKKPLKEFNEKIYESYLKKRDIIKNKKADNHTNNSSGREADGE